MPTLCNRLRESIPEIVRDWEELVDRPPWSGLSETDRLDELPGFLEGLFDLVERPSRGQEHSKEFFDAAAAHGEQRRRLALGYDHVMEESALLRRAVWQHAIPHNDRLQEMVRIDSALTLGLLASLRGYSKQELEARGEWQTTLA